MDRITATVLHRALSAMCGVRFIGSDKQSTCLQMPRKYATAANWEFVVELFYVAFILFFTGVRTLALH